MNSLKRVFSIKGRLFTAYKHYSTDRSAQLIEVTQNNVTGVTTLAMAHEPVNSLNLELLTALKSALTDAKQDGSTGVILTSALPKVFSAGLDIREMYKPDLERAKLFWLTLQQAWTTLYEFERPVAVAINGSCPAGGCLLAISCDHRVFVRGEHTMGLNEVKLGLVVPEWFKQIYVQTLGYRNAEAALLRGTLFSPEEALRIGLVDDLASDTSEAIKKCEQYLLSCNKTSAMARTVTKQKLRQSMVAWMKQNHDSDVKEFLGFIKMPVVQSGIEHYMRALKNKQETQS